MVRSLTVASASAAREESWEPRGVRHHPIKRRGWNLKGSVAASRSSARLENALSAGGFLGSSKLQVGLLSTLFRRDLLWPAAGALLPCPIHTVGVRGRKQHWCFDQKSVCSSRIGVSGPFLWSSVAIAHLNPIALVRHRAGPSNHAEGHESGRGCWASASAHDPGVKQPRQAAHAPARGSAVSASVQ
jgi:hypothetical protein